MLKYLLAALLLLLCFIGSAQKNHSSFVPVVFVHGMLASGDTYALQVERFLEQGYVVSQMAALDWNSVSAGGGRAFAQLDSLINVVMANTGAQQVNLVGHSAGGGVCYGYLKDSAHAAKVAHYVHIGSSRLSKPAQIPTMNVYSADDKISGGADVPGAENVSLKGKDHYEIATCLETFDAMFAFFNGYSPAPVVGQQHKRIRLGGRVVTFGENKPVAFAQIEVYVFDSKTGKRKTTHPLFTALADSLGFWSGFAASLGDYLEFVVMDDSSSRSIHYFREPATRNNPMLYLRTFARRGMAAMLTNALPKDSKQSALVVFSANKAVINGRDSLLANEVELSAKALSTAEKTSIAYFLYDDGDGLTSGRKLAAFGSFPFVNAIDMFIPVGAKGTELRYNGRSMVVPAYPSSEAITVAVFD